ncbi:hypothetical protein ACJIZ3_013589 [Penstemon smallii]|uniref:Cyclin-like domain-containing protein n=1 Tax=Penstemon smallii TaxID=265156 RepID=A0ABD3RNW4_9LAMI
MKKFQAISSTISLQLDEEIDEFGSNVQDDDDDDDEYIQMLLDREINIGTDGLQMQEFFRSDWIQRARLDGIEYILRMRDLLGFRFQTAYLSITYLDRFLQRRSIDATEKAWAVKLVSMACLSLGAKMEESCTVPLLSDFCLKDDHINFESKVIQRMELLVLDTLGWKMGSITPFAFTHFFFKNYYPISISISISIPTTNLLSRIVEIIFGAIKDVKLMNQRPSVLAAAATLFVLDQRFTRNVLELKIYPLASTFNLQIEDIISCYNQVQEIESLKLKKGIN